MTRFSGGTDEGGEDVRKNVEHTFHGHRERAVIFKFVLPCLDLGTMLE